MKYIVILLIGMAVGYSYGFRDSKQHEKTIFTRTIERVGGSNRGKYDQDLEKKAREAER